MTDETRDTIISDLRRGNRMARDAGERHGLAVNPRIAAAGLKDVYDAEETLHLAVETTATGSAYVLSLTNAEGTIRIGSVRVGAGEWTWTANLRGTDAKPGLAASGVARSIRIAVDRQRGALEAHDPARFGYTPGTVIALYARLAGLRGRIGRSDETTPEGIHPSVREALHLQIPERDTLATLLETRGPEGLAMAIDAAILRLRTLYPDVLSGDGDDA